MSKVQADNIATRDGSESTEMTNAINGSAKAWVNFDGTQALEENMIRKAFNVGSITDHGVGNYSLNFTTAMFDTNYVVVGTNRNNFGDYSEDGLSRTTSTVNIMAFSTSGAFGEYQYNSVAIFS